MSNLTPRFRIVIGERRKIALFNAIPDIKFFNRLIRKRSASIESEPVRRAIESSRETAENLVRLSAIYGLFETKNSNIGAWFPAGDYAALGIVTIGSSLERETENLARRNKLAEVFLLDAWGSAFVEGAVDMVDRVIRAEASAIGLRPGKRRSPGYQPWRLESQKTVLDILGGGDIGVRLTESLTMLPRKSVSFGFELNTA